MTFLLLLLALVLGLWSVGSVTSRVPPARRAADAVVAAARANGLAHNRPGLAGAVIYGDSGCANCHTYGGVGSANLGAPDLTAEGKKHRGVPFQVAHLKCPACVTRGSAMPSFAALGARKLRLVAVFLEASKGTGSS